MRPDAPDPNRRKNREAPEVVEPLVVYEKPAGSRNLEDIRQDIEQVFYYEHYWRRHHRLYEYIASQEIFARQSIASNEAMSWRSIQSLSVNINLNFKEQLEMKERRKRRRDKKLGKLRELAQRYYDQENREAAAASMAVARVRLMWHEEQEAQKLRGIIAKDYELETSHLASEFSHGISWDDTLLERLHWSRCRPMAPIGSHGSHGLGTSGNSEARLMVLQILGTDLASPSSTDDCLGYGQWESLLDLRTLRTRATEDLGQSMSLESCEVNGTLEPSTLRKCAPWRHKKWSSGAEDIFMTARRNQSTWHIILVGGLHGQGMFFYVKALREDDWRQHMAKCQNEDQLRLNELRAG
eukprot:gene12796-59_t